MDSPISQYILTKVNYLWFKFFLGQDLSDDDRRYNLSLKYKLVFFLKIAL